LCRQGKTDNAVKVFEDWLAKEPENPIARHMRAACTGRDAPARASDGFVEATFDDYAASFEAKLARLSYRAPALVVAMLEDAGLERSGGLDVLDGGCGTGLCGVLVAPFSRRLVGVDLSDKMLARAKEKNVYHALVRAELTEYLRGNRGAFDLIVSADVLVYFGALDDVLAAAAAALHPGGLLVFTLEHAAGGADVAWRLEMHGRYSHGRAHVERLLAAAGLSATIAEAELRRESCAPVPGLVVRAAKARL
jgi:predicted TPR repeat methyltransferase